MNKIRAIARFISAAIFATALTCCGGSSFTGSNTTEGNTSSVAPQPSIQTEPQPRPISPPQPVGDTQKDSVESEEPIRILSLDGGGIRGIIIASLLAKIESETSKRIYEMFDIIAGTSTGALLAIGLTIPNTDGGALFTAQNLEGVYKNKGDQIFTFRCHPWIPKLACATTGPMYKTETIEAAITELVGTRTFHNLLRPTLITGFDIESKEGIVFDSESPLYNELTLLEVARASSAAPTFFAPKAIMIRRENGFKEKRYFVDGGIFRNNPALLAYQKAVEKFGRETIQKRGIQVFSFGSGWPLVYESTGESLMTAGVKTWAATVVDALIDGAVTEDVRMIQYNIKDNPKSAHVRIQTFLDNLNHNDIMEMDNIKNIPKLLAAARQTTTSPEFKRALELLKSKK